jgi:Lon protease-like protein
MNEELSPAVLSALPIFPLPDCVLLPGGLLPLHVFEPRYREMTRDCLAGDRVMAIARLREGYETDYHGRPPVHRQIGIGKVLESEEQSDGRFLLVLAGVARADIVEELPLSRAYRQVRARVLRDSTADPAELRASRAHLAALCDRLAQLVDGAGALTELARAGTAGRCADAVAAAVVRDPDELQRLLECLSPQARIDRTVELLGALVSRLAPARN